MAKAEYRPAQAARGCRLALAHSAVMPAGPPRARPALRASPPRITAFCPRCSETQPVANAEYRTCQAPSVAFSAAGGRRVLSALARSSHPLRFYIRPRFAKRPPVAALKLRLVSDAAHAPSRVYKTGLMQSGLRWSWARQPQALPGRIRALHASACAPVGQSLRPCISQALRAGLASGLRPVTSSQPPPTPWPRRCAASARRG